ncbi:MAG: hypothetical protein QXJ58_07225 [Archaeoglobaceae archaeon]
MFLIIVHGYYKSKVYLCREKKEVSEILSEFGKGEIYRVDYEKLPLELEEGWVLFEHHLKNDEDVETIIKENTISEEDIKKILDYRRSYYAFQESFLLYDELEKYRDYKFRIFEEEITRKVYNEIVNTSPGKNYFVVVEKPFESIEELKEEKKKNLKSYEPISHDILLNYIPHESVFLIDLGIIEIRKLKDVQELPFLDSEVTLDRKKTKATLETEKGLIMVDGDKVFFRGRFTSKEIDAWVTEINSKVPEWCPSKENVLNAYERVLGKDVSDLVSEMFIVPRVVKDDKVFPGKVIIIPKDESQAGLLIGKQGRIAKKVSEILDGYYIKIKTSRDELRRKLSELSEKLIQSPSGD